MTTESPRYIPFSVDPFSCVAYEILIDGKVTPSLTAMQFVAYSLIAFAYVVNTLPENTSDVLLVAWSTLRRRGLRRVDVIENAGATALGYPGFDRNSATLSAIWAAAGRSRGPATVTSLPIASDSITGGGKTLPVLKHTGLICGSP